MTIEAIIAFLTSVHALEWSACAFSIAGAELLSRRKTYSSWGWAVWLVSNILFIAFAAVTHQWGILTTQLWFMKTSAIGIYNHLIPHLRVQHDKA